MSEAERLATLEAESAEASSQRAEIKTKLDAQDEDLRAIRSDVHEIRETISGHLGFLKGVVFVFTAIGGLLGAGAAAFWGKLFGGE